MRYRKIKYIYNPQKNLKKIIYEIFNAYKLPAKFHKNEGSIYSLFKGLDPYLNRRDFRAAAKKEIYSFYSLLSLGLYIRTVFDDRIYYSSTQNCFIIITYQQNYMYPDGLIFPLYIYREEMTRFLSSLLKKLYGPLISFLFTFLIYNYLKRN